MKQEEIAEKVANYWSKYLTGEKTPNFNNGDDSVNGGLGAMLFALGNSKQKHTSKEITNFKQQFKETLLDSCIRRVGVDYHPDWILDDTCRATLSNYSSMLTFPVKTLMFIDWNTGKLEVKEGYGAEWKTI